MRQICAISISLTLVWRLPLATDASGIIRANRRGALSRQIAELENELGVRIFSRTRNKIAGLTLQGEEILAIGQRITREADALRQVGGRKGDTTSELRIATTHTHARYALPWVIKHFTKRCPEVLLDLRQGDPAQCFQLIARGEADLAITVETARIPRDIVTIPIFKLARCVLAPRGHPLERGRLTLQRIAKYPMIAYSRPPDWKWLFGDVFAQAELKPPIALSALDVDVSKTYVSMGIGIAVLATMAYDPARDRDLVAIDANHLFRPGILTLVLRKGTYISRQTHTFLSAFCPHIDAALIQKCVDGMPVDRTELLRKNRSGRWQFAPHSASDNIGAQLSAKAPADGYTLLLATITLATSPALYKSLGYDPLRDLDPITLIAGVPHLLVVHPSLPVTNVKELIALAKSRPGELNYASAGKWQSVSPAAELFNLLAGVKMNHVSYKGGGPAVSDVIGGQVQLTFANLLAVLPHVQAGKLRGLGITSSVRSTAAPNLPTIAESGLKGYDFTSWFGMLAPAGTPKDVVQKLNQELVKVLRSPEFKERLTRDGADIVASTPQEFGAYMKSETAKWAKVIKEAGIRAE